MTDPNPRDIATLVALFNGRHLDEACELSKSLTKRFPSNGFCWKVLGACLGQTGQVVEALPALQKAAELSPEDAEAHNNLGNAQRTLGKLCDAETSYRRALAIRAEFADAWSGLGNTLSGLSRLEEAEISYRHALQIRPDFALAHSNFLLMLNCMPGRDPVEIYAHHRRFEEQCCLSFAQVPHHNESSPERRLRVGYVSADFRDHAVAYFIEPVLEKHDRSKVESFCYYTFSRVDAVTLRLKTHADHWRDVPDLSDGALADAIREDEIDILIDLSGHTANNRLLVFARKPAPVQATWLGYLNTTGLRAIDYRITDAHATPPGPLEACHAEKLIRLPHSQWCYRPPSASPDIDPASRQAITFGVLSTPAKINARSIDLWGRILQRIQDSRLLVVTYGLSAPPQEFRERFVQRGVPRECLQVVGSMPFKEYLLIHNSVDIVLDTFPYSGGTTTCHALWMGVPVVSLNGVTATSRGGASLLHAIGLPELIAANEEEYIGIAIKLAIDDARRAAIRSSLRERMQASPLMDEKAFARNLEDAYRSMWRAWCEVSP